MRTVNNIVSGRINWWENTRVVLIMWNLDTGPRRLMFQILPNSQCLFTITINRNTVSGNSLVDFYEINTRDSCKQ